MKMKKAPKIPYPVTVVLADNRKNWLTVLLAILFFIWELAIFYYYFKGQLQLAFLILLHCVAVGLLVLFNFICYRRKEDLRYPLLLLLAVFGLGPFGIAGLFIFMLLRPLISLLASPFSKWFHDLFPEHGNIFTNVFQRIKSGWDDYSKPVEIIPFHDFFTYGSLIQKQAVLDQVAEHYKAEYTPILKEALKDPSNVIRIQAAAIEAKIDHDFEFQLKELVRARSPRDPDTLYRIAKHYDYYAYLNVFNPIRERECQQQAIQYYQQYLKKQPDESKAWLSVGRLLVRIKDYSGVIKWFEEFKKQFKEHSLNMYPWYLEALYHQKDYEQLSSEARQILPTLRKQQFPQEILDNIAVWGENAQGD
jgi:hypothetical protein